MKKALIGLTVVVALILGGVLIAPTFIDWNARLPEIAAQVKNVTGRDLKVDGRLEVRLLPAPMLTARGVSLGNVAQGVAPEMVSLEAVEVRVALMPLLSGQVQVERIHLVKPVIHIEAYADGRSNLEFQSGRSVGGDTAPGQASPDQGADGDGTGLGVRLDNFEIIDATVIYQDAKGKIERVENVSATLRAASLEGPFEIKGEARVRGVPLGFEASLGQVIAGRTVPINAVIKAPGGAAIDVGGAIYEVETAPRFKGKVKAEGADLAALVGAVVGADATPGVLQQAFAMDGNLVASAKTFDLSELELSLGDTRVTGSAHATLAQDISFQVDLNAARIDADSFLNTMARTPIKTSVNNSANANGGAPRIAPKPPVNGDAEAGGGFVLPKNISGTLGVRVDAVTYKGGVVKDVRLNAELADGELALSQFQLQAPGVTDFALFGFVKPQKGQPRFTGDLELTTANPKGLAQWLGVDMPTGVADRLKRVAFKSKVIADPSQVSLNAIDLVGDHTRLSGGVTVALRARPSFGADVRIDTLNLDAYANGNGALKAQAASAAGGDGGAKAQDQTQAAKAMDALKIWAQTAVLNDFDANLKIAIDALTVGGRVFKALQLDGTLYAGSLELRQLKLGDMLGASANLAGKFNGFGGVPEMTGVKAEAQVKDANALADALSVAGIPPRLGAVKVTLGAEGSLLKPALNASVNALGGDYTAKGRASLLPIGFGWDGEVSAKHANAQSLLSRLGYVAAGPLGALNIKANLKTDGATHTLSNISGSIDETALGGTVTAKTNLSKPYVTADLKTGVLYVQRFLAKDEKRADAQPQRNPLMMLAGYTSDAAVAQVPSRVDKRWSREAFDLAALNAVDADLTLKSDAIEFGDYRLETADIHATVKDGVMTADRVVGLLFGGPVSGTAIVRANGQPTLETTIKLDAMDVGRAVQAVAGKDLARGRLGLDMNFASTGVSPAELVSALSGAGSLKIDALDVKQGGTGTALAPVIGLVATLNQFALPGVDGGANAKSGLADLALSFDIKDGVALAKSMALNSAFGSGTGSGSVDIAAWAIDFAGTMTIEPNVLTTLLSKGRVGKQEVPFTLKGVLDKPGVNLGIRPAGGTPDAGGQAVDPVRGLLNQIMPGVLPPKQPTPQPAPTQPAPSEGDGSVLPPPPQQGGSAQPQPQQRLTPEDIFKQLMQGR